MGETINTFYYAALFFLLVYYTYISIFKKKGLNKKYAEKYTKESLEQYSIYSGIGCAIGALGFLFLLLSNLGILKIMDMTDQKQYLTVGVVVLILICIPMFLGRRKLVKINQPSMNDQLEGRGKGRKKEDEEDF